MNIRYATEQDTIRIIRAIQNKHMNYNTPADVHEDVKTREPAQPARSNLDRLSGLTGKPLVTKERQRKT